MKVGFIGTGSMGSLLVEAFVKAGAMQPADIAVSSRTRDQSRSAGAACSGLRIAASNVDAARQAELLFLCVKPADFQAVLTEIAPNLRTAANRHFHHKSGHALPTGMLFAVQGGESHSQHRECGSFGRRVNDLGLPLE